MASRYYNGTYRAAGETAHHARVQECVNKIRRLRREINAWTRFAEKAVTDADRAIAQRKINACCYFIDLSNANMDEAWQAVTDYERRTAGTGAA